MILFVQTFHVCVSVCVCVCVGGGGGVWLRGGEVEYESSMK